MARLPVDGLKAQILDRLQRGQLIRFSDKLEPVFYEQLTSERRVLRYVRGQPVRRFERVARKRGESLDATVYAFAARAAVNVSLDVRAGELRQAMPPLRQLSSIYKSEWMSR